MTEKTVEFESRILQERIHPISLHSTVEYNDKLYVFGGVDTFIIPQNKFISVDKKTLETEEIVTKQKTPLERCGHISFIHEDKMYVHGGKQHGELFDETLIYDFKEKEWKETTLGSENILGARCFHSCVILKNQLFVFGGITKNHTKNYFFKFDFSEDKWTEIEIESSPEQRFGQSMNLKDDSKIILFGGECKSEFYNDIHQYDIENNKWEHIKPENTEIIPAGRSKHSSFLLDDCLWIFGGHLGNGIYKNELFKFNFKTKLWSEVHFKGFPLAGQGMSIIPINEKSFYILGGHKGTLVGTGDCENSIIILQKFEEEK
eukprot:gene5805-9628_t